MRPPRLTGTLFRILDEGFGFIHSDCGGRDHFVSIAEMRNRADWQAASAAIADKGGLRVSFCSGAPKAKNQAPRAVDVAPLDLANESPFQKADRIAQERRKGDQKCQ
jgi:cold shock CspA family protein